MEILLTPVRFVMESQTVEIHRTSGENFAHRLFVERTNLNVIMVLASAEKACATTKPTVLMDQMSSIVVNREAVASKFSIFLNVNLKFFYSC